MFRIEAAEQVKDILAAVQRFVARNKFPNQHAIDLLRFDLHGIYLHREPAFL